MKFLIYGHSGWIGQQFCEAVKSAGDKAYPGGRVRFVQDVIADVEKWNPDRVVCALGRTSGPLNNTVDYLEQPGKLTDNVGSNLTAPVLVALATSGLHGRSIPLLYIGSGCIFEYDATHTVGGHGFREDENANFFGSSYSIVKGQTDLLMKGFPHVLNARVRMPISVQSNPRDFITKIVGYKKIISVKNSMTILSDWIPFLIALLVHMKTGTINAVNPGSIDHDTVLKQYESSAKTKLNYILVPPSEQSDLVVAKRSNNLLTADKAIVMMNELIQETKNRYSVPAVLKPINERIMEILALRFRNPVIDMMYPPPAQNRSANNPERVLLVTGGAGFIGSSFINYWLTGHRKDIVINFDALLTNSNLRNIENPQDPNYKFIHADLLDERELRRTFEQNHITHVIHFAAASTVDPSFGHPLTYIENNIIGMFNLLETIKIYRENFQLFVHISTDEVYGEVPTGSCAEHNTPFFPTNPYAATKAGAECLLMSYGKSFGLPYVITRANNVYGKYQFPTQVIPKFVTCLLSDQKLPVHGAGLMSRRFLHVEDYCTALQTVVEKGVIGEVYNIGTDDEIQIIQLCRLLVTKVHGSDDPAQYIEYVTDRPHNDCRYSVDSSKIRALGWTSKVDFDTGLDQTVDWYRTAKRHWEMGDPFQRNGASGTSVFQCT
ncbi:hypothetical protein RvY_02097 [Ramazzottius varieornatus]|uniref:NAD(P)-binding domain-containing protein n=1 Tax=Ramazzottius varieornatus TaxID=947166 RepID=A0A1D1ULY4_RAMVA|nr:hypothetical protein RvY_02097 [Ramazzottius varieornatus]